MGSRRLEKIQTAIQQLADAKITGLEAEVAAAWDVLGARLPGNVKQEDALSVRQAQAATAAELMATQTLFAGSAKNIAAGFSSVRDGLEALGISNDQADAAVDAALGIAVQAGQFFLHPETYTVVQGRQVGQLTEAMVRLAGVLQPGEEINPAAIAERLKVKPSSASHLLGRIREASGDSVIGSAGKGRYRRNPALTILGEEPSAPPVVVSVEEEGSPATYSMKQILQQKEVAGVLSEPQVRHLIRGLVASGHFQVGEHVVETNPQPRGKAKEMVWDLEVTPVGLEILGFVAEKFGARGKIYVNSVVQELNQQRTAPAAQPADEGQRFWGAQLVAGLKHVGTGALDTLQAAGIFKKGQHFETTASGKRIYRPAAREIARRLDKAAAAAPIGRITQDFVLKTFGQPEKRKPKPAQSEFPDYGPNGPGVLTPLHELAALNLLQKCAPKIGDRLGGEISPEFSEDLGKWIQAKQAELMESTPEGAVSENDKLRIRRETAAAVTEMYRDLRLFNNVRQELGGLEFVADFIKAARRKGEIGTRVVMDFAGTLVNPPTVIKDPATPWNGGVVGNGIKKIGPLG